MNIIRLSLLAAALLPFSFPALGADNGQSAWKDSIVRFDVTRNDHNFRVPWDKRPQTVSKLGAVIDDNEILTTARGLANHTLVRLQKGGRGRWFDGEVKWVDYQANLAVVDVDDEAFWSGLVPVQFAGADQLRDNLQVCLLYTSDAADD